jgi:hypothetical protein
MFVRLSARDANNKCRKITHGRSFQVIAATSRDANHQHFSISAVVNPFAPQTTPRSGNF